VKVSNDVNEKDELLHSVEALKDKIRTIARVGMVNGRNKAYSQVTSASNALEFKLWRSRRRKNVVPSILGMKRGNETVRIATTADARSRGKG
jgi:hypothetical protein